MWPLSPTSFSKRSLWKPLKTLITTMRAVTPAMTPRNEISAMAETEPDERRALR